MKLNDVTRGTGLEEHGITNANLIYWTPITPVLYEQIVRRGEGLISHLGAIAVKTGHYTGRAANEKFIVDEPTSHANVAWGKVNRPLSPEKFDALYKRMLRLYAWQGPVRAGLFCRRRQGTSASDPRDHGTGVALAICPQHVHAGDTGGA